MTRILPFLVLGPLTGPLTAGLLYMFRAQRFGMAAVYALGLLEVAVGLPAIFARELKFIIAHMR